MRLFVSALVVLGGVTCASDAGPSQEGSTGCGDGLTEHSSTIEVQGPGADTKEDAIRAELLHLGFEVSDEAIGDAIAGAVPAASPRGDVGVFMDTSEGFELFMTLTPVDPGWAVEGSSWCVPA